MIIVGLAFKASAAPFHMWTPDVYEGAPTPVTGFMAAATKVAALVVTLRLLVTAFPGEEDLWTVALAVIVCISLAWGNLAAIVQTNVKRLLAYSSISHAGFLLMPIAAGNALGGRALLYYLIPYAAMSLGAFAVVAVRERELREPVTLAEPRRLRLGAAVPRRLDGPLHVRLHRPAARRDLPREVLRLLGGDRPRLDVARHRRRRRHRGLGLLLRERHPRDVHAAPRAAPSSPRAARRRPIACSSPRSRRPGSSPSAASSSPTRCSTSPRTRSPPSPSRWARWRSASSSSAPVSTGEAFVAALRRLDDKAEITVVERELVGGECSYWACIPSKTLLRPLEVVARARLAPGADEAVGAGGRLAGVFGWRDQVAEKDDTSQAEWLANQGAELVRGHRRRQRARARPRRRPGAPVRRAPGRDRLGAARRRRSKGSTRSRTGRAARRRAPTPCRRASWSSGAAPSAASWRSCYARLGSKVTLVQGGDHLLPQAGPRGHGPPGRGLRRGRRRASLRRPGDARRAAAATIPSGSSSTATEAGGGRAAPRRHGPQAERRRLRPRAPRRDLREARHRRRRPARGRRRTSGPPGTSRASRSSRTWASTRAASPRRTSPAATTRRLPRRSRLPSSPTPRSPRPATPAARAPSRRPGGSSPSRAPRRSSGRSSRAS